MATKKENPVYGFANATYSHGYGHVTIHIYELLGYNGGTLKITCQSGGESGRGETYAWDYGVSNDYSVMKLNALKMGYSLMRRVNRLMDKEYTDNGSPANFAEFAVRVLRAAGIRRVHVKSPINAGYCGDVKDLPRFDPLRDGDALFNTLRAMELDIIGRG